MFGIGGASAPSGMEMMLRNLGLGDVIEAAKRLASTQSVDKIVQFADGVEGYNDRLARIERRLDALCRAGGIPTDDPDGAAGDTAGNERLGLPSPD